VPKDKEVVASMEKTPSIPKEQLKVEIIDYDHIFDIDTTDNQINVIIDHIEVNPKKHKSGKKVKPKTAFRREQNPLADMNDYKDT
jgi:hypothetical protein